MNRADLNQFIIVSSVGAAVLALLVGPVADRALNRLTDLQQAGLYFLGTAAVIGFIAWGITRR